jgi:uncharacterized DUF497 family protein
MIILDKLVWTVINKEHIARHDVSQIEIEQVCHNDPVFVSGHSGRIMVIGKTNVNRAISIILDPEHEKGVWYVVTARSADRKERTLYKTMKGESS